MKKILIAGGGKMGCWFATLLKDRYIVSVYDPAAETETLPHDIMRLIDHEEITRFRPDMLLNCVSLGSTVDAFNELSGLVPDYCMLADIASVKGSLPQYYQYGKRRYVSIHPMFGPTFARFDNLKGLNTIIIEESDIDGKEFFVNLLEPMGINLSYATFREHDELMAKVLAVPAVSTLLFACCTNVSLTGGTSYARHMEIAEGLLREDAELVSMIIANNYSSAILENMNGLLSSLQERIKANDIEGIAEVFRRTSASFLAPEEPSIRQGPQ